MDKGEFEKRRTELTTRREQVMNSMSEFYRRLPDIQDATLAMTEFKSHNDELIDYIIKLESLWNKVDEARKEFPTLLDAEKRFKDLPQKIQGVKKERLYNIPRAYYDLVKEWREKWLGK